jgi:MerR family transcriptional regulator, light-induced transcriptional regulator
LDLFSISKLSRYSGIKPHTIRVWEQRYNALRPNRSEGNTRYYDNSQLRRLLNIVSLMETGYKVSELCSMPDKKLFGLLGELQNRDNQTEPIEYFVSQLLVAGMNYDEPYFEKIFSHCLLRLGMKNTYLKVIYPMLLRVGLMWTVDSIPPANEHFITNILRQKLFTSIDSLPTSEQNSATWLLFLPENEFHEIGLLFSHYLVRLFGKKVIYLGSNLPFQSLISAVKEVRPENLLFFLVNNDLPGNTNEYLDKLNGLPVKRIYAAGRPDVTDQLKTCKKIDWLYSVEDLEKVLAK